jgi:hypothetical protein
MALKKQHQKRGSERTSPTGKRDREPEKDRKRRRKMSKPKTRKRGYKADPGKADLASPSHTAGITVVSG